MKDPTELLNEIQPQAPFVKASEHDTMSQLLNFQKKNNPSSDAFAFSNALPGIFSSFASLIHELIEELQTHLSHLLALNPSRRQAIVQYLEKLSSCPLPEPTLSPWEQKNKLKQWINDPKNQAQNQAIQTYLEEIASIALSQMLVLKSWSDRGIRRWDSSDLGRLNWALSTVLKPYLPTEREGWQITKPNLYSWFNPSKGMQKKIVQVLESFSLLEEGPQFLLQLVYFLKKAQPESPDPCGYDTRFFKSLWKQMELFGFDPHAQKPWIQQNKIIFSPTLRDTSVSQEAPDALNWIGLEASAFQLMLGELMQVWHAPCAPPYWAIGTGLEVHTRNQLPLENQKPSTLSYITQMQACDATFVFEEQIIRTQSRNLYAQKFRELLDLLPYFKSLRTGGTSLGALQACVALSKLRSEGVLFWLREEALSEKDGPEVLSFLLQRAKLVCEWDFSKMHHSLPSRLPLYPRYMYIFERQNDPQFQIKHRPIKNTIQGQLRSHIELEWFLEDVFSLSEPRGPWKILSHMSPSPQKEWIEKWPNPTSQDLIEKLETLRALSLPLANLATVRATPESTEPHDKKWSVHESLYGFWIKPDYQGTRKLVAKPLPRLEKESEGSGFMILLPQESWMAPMMAYITSSWVQEWLDHHAERRGERWVLSQQILKWIPITKTLAEGLTREHLPLPDPWNLLLEKFSANLNPIEEALKKLPPSDSYYFQIHTQLFVKTAKSIYDQEMKLKQLLTWIKPDGQIAWKALFHLIPKEDCVSIPLHPKIKLSGSLPPHLPIGNIQRTENPLSILLATESGFHLRIHSENPILIPMIWEQLEGIVHPTWNELVQYVKLPRQIQVAEATASEILASYQNHQKELGKLKELLKLCQLF
jgi:hypothetical protein